MIQTDLNPYKENTIIVGMAQSGKTTFAKKIAKMLVESGHNVIVFDPNRRFTELAPYAVVHNLHEVHANGICIIQPLANSPKFFEDLCKKVMSFGNVNFMADEIHNYSSKYKVENNFAFMLRNCNNYNIGYLCIFQRPAEIPNMVISNAHHRFCFILDLPDDIKFMKKWLGSAVERFSADSTQPVPKYHGFYKKAGYPIEEFEA